MLDSLLTQAEDLLSQMDEAAAGDDYAKATEISGRLDKLLLKLKDEPREELEQSRERIAAIADKLSESMSSASEEQKKVRSEIIKFNKKAAGVSAYRANGGLSLRRR
jgi:hypothetical protein